MPRPTAHIVALTALASVLVGCDSTRPAARITTAGDSWQAVLPGAAVASTLAESDGEGWITTRNDRHLNLRLIEPVLATTAWPQAPRPSLSRPRYIRLHRSPESFIYYRAEERFEYRRGR
jgi:hypothetical protein